MLFLGFLCCGEWGLLLVVVHGPLTAVASLAGEHRLESLQTLHTCGSQARQCGPRNCGTWADLLRGVWNLPRPGIKLRPLPLQVDLYPFCHQGSPAAAAKSLQSCPTLCDPIDGSPPGSPVPGILQARTLEWVAISFSNA